jgi:hypothetical protein
MGRSHHLIESITRELGAKPKSPRITRPSQMIEEIRKLTAVDRDAMLESVDQKLPLLLRQFPEFDEAKIREIGTADPTPQAAYITWLLRQTRMNHFRWPEDADKVRETLAEFHRIKQIGSVEMERDINRYRTYPDLLAVVRANVNARGKETAKKAPVEKSVCPGLELLFETKAPKGSQWRFYKVMSVEAAHYVAKQGTDGHGNPQKTQWCTIGPDQANIHLNKGPLWVVFVKRPATPEKPESRFEPFAQLHFQTDQFMDRDDQELMDDVRFALIKKLSPYTGISLENDPGLAFAYAECMGARFPAGEPIMLKKCDASNLVAYAEFTVIGRWPEAEPKILTDLPEAIVYAENVIKGRWPELEAALLEHGTPSNLVQYAADVIKGKWLEAEPKINKDASAKRQYQQIGA